MSRRPSSWPVSPGRPSASRAWWQADFVYGVYDNTAAWPDELPFQRECECDEDETCEPCLLEAYGAVTPTC